MKILTLNTWGESGPWKERWEVILKGLDQLRPEIVAFQELFDTDWCREISHRASYPFVAFPGSPSSPRSSSGLAVLSRFPIEKSQLYTMRRRSPFENYGRYAFWTVVRCGYRTVHFFNTHLSWKLQDRSTRRAQVEETWEWIKTSAGGDEAVLVGDMNATPDSGEITWFLKQSGFIDAYGYLHPEDQGFSWDNSKNRFTASHVPPLPDRRIDFIMVRGKGLVENLAECGLVYTEPDARGVFASDHFGVLAKFANY